MIRFNLIGSWSSHRARRRMTTQSRAVLQRILQRRTNWAPAGESFGCPRCHAKHAVIRRQTPPGMIPACEICDQEFPAAEDGEWLLYERSDA
jgi:transcription elongation factor Elf1